MTADAVTLTDFLLARIAEDVDNYRKWALGGEIKQGFRDRLLAECEAKRRIIATMQTAIDQAWQDGAARPVIEAIAERTLRLLAAPYADHPDCRPEWAV